MKTYTKEELAHYAKGVLAEMNVPAILANEAGDFRTPEQVAELNDEERKASFKFKFENEAYKEPGAAADPELAAKLAAATEELEAANKEIARLNELKSVTGAKAALAEKDEQIAALNAKIEQLSNPNKDEKAPE